METHSIVHNADCLAAMKEYPENYFQLCIADPPYGINAANFNMGSRKTVRPDKKQWDIKPPDQSYFKEMFRISQNQIFFGGNYFDLPPTRCFIIWDKGETMYGRSFAECEMAWTSFDASARMFKLSPNQLNRIHTCEKPIALYKWILQNYAKQGDRIIDPFLGSGSSRIAAYDLGFDFTGYELDTDYFEAQERRFAEYIKQPKLFEPIQQIEKQEGLFSL